MNKGRNIAIALLIMLLISIQFFFMLVGRGNDEGVVDGVRYIFQSGNIEDDQVKNYKFYYEDSPERDVTVTTVGNSKRITIQGSDYTYIVTGEKKRDFDITYEYYGKYTGTDEEAYAVHTKKLFKSMVFGKEPLLKLYEAVIVSLTAAIGGLIFGNAERLWYKFSKKKFPEDYEPVWNDFRMYKVIGSAIMCAAAVLFLIFILF